MASPLTAANAYAALSKLGAGAGALGPKAAGTEGSFGDMLKGALGSVVDAGRKADLQAQSMAAGKANIVDVVTEVSETEVAIQTLVSVRDRVIQSYEEIMRMPI